MTDYTELVKALRDIEKTMFALGTSPINMDNVSIRLAYDKRWWPTASDAAAAIEELSKTVKDLTTKVECSPMQISGKAFDRAIEAWNEKERKAVQDGQE